MNQCAWKLNRGKSSIIGLNCYPAKLSSWASLVAREVFQFLSSYIGLPLGVICGVRFSESYLTSNLETTI